MNILHKHIIIFKLRREVLKTEGGKDIYSKSTLFLLFLFWKKVSISVDYAVHNVVN